MPEKKKFYVTTPLCSASSSPRISHARAALAADVLCRHMRALGRAVFFQAGADGYAAGVERTAAGRGSSPREWAEEISNGFERAWKLLNISYDSFVRTTEPGHERKVQDVFERLRASGDIYPGAFSGGYCPSCDDLHEERDLHGEKLCPVHGERTEDAGGEAYFFRLSRYGEKLLDLYASEPSFLAPEQEAAGIRDLVKSGLKDIPVSRPAGTWGIPVKSDASQAIRPWFGALLGYVTGAGWDPGGEEGEFRAAWPADVHLTDWELFRSHAVTWPAILMALGLKLPRRIAASGRPPAEAGKASRPTEKDISPSDAIKEYGADALRYFVLREIPSEKDGDFSTEDFKRRYNADLAGELGDLFSRVVAMAGEHLGNKLPRKPEEASARTFAGLRKLDAVIAADIEDLRLGPALDRIWGAVGDLNRRIDSEYPLELAKKDTAALESFLKDMVWSLRLVAGWIYPFLPDASARMQMLMSIGDTEAGDVEPQKVPALFPRKP